jgi:hypothetical protein
VDRIQPGRRDEVIAGQGADHLLVGDAPVLMAAAHYQHPKMAASKRDRRPGKPWRRRCCAGAAAGGDQDAAIRELPA